MVGSYAPVHSGHFDTMRSAERRLLTTGDDIAGNVFAPNSDSYVLKKLDDEDGVWNFDRRISEFVSRSSGTEGVSYVDNITGSKPPEKSISESVIDTVSSRLGIRACSLVLVVGMDQIRSMEPHLDSNRAICVLRPGYESQLQEVAQDDWFVDAIDTKRLLLTSRENTEIDISSTIIRKKLEGAIND
jgi:nicotinic acid mononucleotide adenylyltransferase